jgi:membrane-associated phospholipid phosphatase
MSARSLRARILCALCWGSLVLALFAVVFGGADWLTAHRSLRIPVHTRWELSLPLAPGWVSVYMTIYLVFLAAPLALRSVRQVRALALAECGVILVAGMGFLLCPSELAFAAPANLGRWAGLFRFADRLNLDYNLVPSLHVALTVTCVSAYSYRAGVFWWTWAVAIAVSTVLTHQHHLLDVVTGWALGLAGGWSYRRLAAGEEAGEVVRVEPVAEVRRERDRRLGP